jgi:hypothetical protein
MELWGSWFSNSGGEEGQPLRVDGVAEGKRRRMIIKTKSTHVYVNK